MNKFKVRHRIFELQTPRKIPSKEDPILGIYRSFPIIGDPARVVCLAGTAEIHRFAAAKGQLSVAYHEDSDGVGRG